MHICTCAIKNVLAETVFCGFPRNKVVLTMTVFVMSISLPSFMFVSAAVSEIRTRLEPEQEIFENGYFQFSTFPRHVTDANKSYISTH